MHAGRGAPKAVDPSALRGGRWRRVRAAAAAFALWLVFMATVRIALLAFGALFFATFTGGSRAAVLAYAAALLGCLVVLGVSWSWARRCAAGWMPPAVVTTIAVALFAADYPHTLAEPHGCDVYGIYTQTPSSTWTDSAPNREAVVYRTNALGFRGDEFTVAKPPGKIRIALLGDSFIFNMGVSEGDTLKARLDEGLAAAGLSDRVDVLNLGIPGANIATHIGMYAIARDHFAADVFVMGLVVWNDLSEWDVENEQLGRATPSPFSALGYLIGQGPAVAVTTALLVQHGSERRSLHALDNQLARLSAMRERDGAPPLLMLPFWSMPAIAQRFEGKNNIHYVRHDDRAAYYIPNDGHPTGLGNKAFAAAVLAELGSLPDGGAAALALRRLAAVNTPSAPH